MSDSQDPSSYASPPFDHEKADVILRSSNNVDFRVFKLFLSLASPFFETLFNLPQPSEETSTDVVTKDGLPVIPLSEDSETLDSLLRLCYPCTLVEIATLEDFRVLANVLEAAKKYSLAEIKRMACESLFSPEILEANSLRCFVIACRSCMQDECALAARYTLREPLVPTWFEEIELITSTELLALLTYHRKCGTAIQTLKDDFSWMNTQYPQWTAAPWMVGKTPSGSPCCTRSSSRRYRLFPGTEAAQWFEAFMDSTFLDMQDKPCVETVHRNIEKAVQTVRQGDCRHCSVAVPGGMRDFGVLLIDKVEELIGKVELDLKF
ncbi:hypothetical protein BKA82DRAFT_32653 [Pisolithus tinctorius]|uniref:BTB domain-containing protein n=1 Tax=Pisolithus tinctorius Marx 270 TaxID=870435 RepID=A0A0C3JHH0_PISTI|nr:hypothetical protein BKA82DRAFT_32653 [Pisolithus tinctorius]KIN97061.1 hypothetical protein M404DRAFT_32653 [Pisolithus tinctorius Marx 270]